MKKISVTDDLISRYLSGDINSEEQQTLLRWLNESPENEKQLFIIKDIYDGAAKERFFEEAQTDEGWERLQLQFANRNEQKNRTTQKPRKIVRWAAHIGRYAAAVLIGISATIAFLHYLSPNDRPTEAIVTTNHVTTGKGERATATLPDGSTVRLNACSSLTYRSDYGKNDRDVVFSGEAYFDIRTNPDMPFTVKTHGLNIKAYGTAFNVKAYDDEDMIETTLVKGVVLIENQHNRQIITLEPNQVFAIPKAMAAANPEHTTTTTIPDDQLPAKNEKINLQKNIPHAEAVIRKNVKTEEFTSWKDDKWIIKSESLESLVKKIERRYDVTVRIDDDASKKYVFSGTLKNYPLEQVLDIIRLNAPIQYTVKENTVVIREDKELKKRYQKLIYNL